MNIAVVGTGYVGLSLAVLLAQHNTVYAVDIIPKKVEMINRGKSPIQDKEIEEYLAGGKLSLTATMDAASAYRKADFVIVSTPTDYDPDRNYFNTSSVESVIAQALEINPKVYVVVKSTVPIGFTRRMQEEHGTSHILFSPEFLREGLALYDNLYPSRIIVGVDREDAEAVERANSFSGLLQQAAKKVDVDVLVMEPTEAEAVKLFANTYLALRVAYFNELDTYAEMKGLDAKSIIQGVGFDPRIGTHYNNPSFGYGGYCLPKDTKQLLADYDGVPNDLIAAIVASNTTRKKYIAERVARKVSGSEANRVEANGAEASGVEAGGAEASGAEASGKSHVIGIYRLIMKAGSDNFRQSAIQDVIRFLRADQACSVVIYEPTLDADEFAGCEVIRDFDVFAEQSALILANRMTAELRGVQDKVYTRDIFAID